MSHWVRISVYGETKTKIPRQRKALFGKVKFSFSHPSASPGPVGRSLRSSTGCPDGPRGLGGRSVWSQHCSLNWVSWALQPWVWLERGSRCGSPRREGLVRGARSVGRGGCWAQRRVLENKAQREGWQGTVSIVCEQSERTQTQTLQKTPREAETWEM